jgi:ferredoxin
MTTMPRLLHPEVQKAILRASETTNLSELARQLGISLASVRRCRKRGRVRLNYKREGSLSEREWREGRTTCLSCGGPIPCISCAQRVRSQSGLKGTEPTEPANLDLDDVQIQRDGKTVKQLAAEIRDSWDPIEREMRSGYPTQHIEFDVCHSATRDIGGTLSEIK